MSLLSVNERAELLLDSMIADLKEQQKFNTEYSKGRAFQLGLNIQSLIIYFPDLKSKYDASTTH